MKHSKRTDQLKKSTDIFGEAYKTFQQAIDSHKNDISIFCFSSLKLCADIDRVKFEFVASIEEKNDDHFGILIEFDFQGIVCNDNCLIRVDFSELEYYMADSYSRDEIHDIFTNDNTDTLNAIIRDYILKEY